MPEVEKIEFSGAILEGECYLRAFDVTSALRHAIEFYEDLIAKAPETPAEGHEVEWLTSLSGWACAIEVLQAEADAYDVAAMSFLADPDNAEDDEDA